MINPAFVRWAQKTKARLSNHAFAKSFGFKVVDATPNGYELLALSFDGTIPRFSQNAKAESIESQALTIYYNMQCPYMQQSTETVAQYCAGSGVPLALIPVDTLQKAKDLPCAFNNFAVFYRGN